MRFTVLTKVSRIIFSLCGGRNRDPDRCDHGESLFRSEQRIDLAVGDLELKPLTKEDIRQLLFRAVEDNERGMGSYRVVLEDDAADFLADVANGDARSALNALELGVLSTERSEDDKIHIDMEVAGECIQKRVLRYDKSGTIITIRSQRLSRVCGDPIRMRQCIIWHGCFMPGRMWRLLHVVS